MDISNHNLRTAIYKVFGGRCFYTGRKVSEEDMVIDHVVPKSKGGEDSPYNYVLTTKDINSSKSDKIDLDGVDPILYLIRTVYAPKVLRLIKPKASGSKKRTTIYIDSSVWKLVTDEAWRQRKSASALLESIIVAVSGQFVEAKKPALGKKSKIEKLRDTGVFNPQPK